MPRIDIASVPVKTGSAHPERFASQMAGRSSLRLGGAGGDTDGHHFVNRSDAQARFLVVGTRGKREVATYSDVDLMVELNNGSATSTHKDGRPYQAPETGENT